MESYENIIYLILGIPLGILASYLAWWIVSHKIIPNILFASVISNRHDTYRFAIMNNGKRNVIDVTIIAELIISGIDKVAPQNTSHVRLGLNKKYLIKISPKKLWTININTNKLPTQISKNFPNDTLQEILKNTKSKLRLSVFGYDSFSGAKKLYQSKYYTDKDIKNVYFKEELHFQTKTKNCFK